VLAYWSTDTQLTNTAGCQRRRRSLRDHAIARRVRRGRRRRLSSYVPPPHRAARPPARREECSPPATLHFLSTPLPSSPPVRACSPGPKGVRAHKLIFFAYKRSACGQTNWTRRLRPGGGPHLDWGRRERGRTWGDMMLSTVSCRVVSIRSSHGAAAAAQAPISHILSLTSSHPPRHLELTLPLLPSSTENVYFVTKPK